LKGVEPRGAAVAITGASAGIGWASALAFARAGSRLALAARRVDRLEALAAEVRALGSEALVMAVDVVSAVDVQRFVEATVERFGRVDVIVNNAGSGVRGFVDETPVEDYRRMMEVNYHDRRHVGLTFTHATLPVRRRRREAGVGSLGASLPSPAPPFAAIPTRPSDPRPRA
jgi:NADP-dependent 3-hydroxy acid dehydrogenase YdfG